MTSAQDDGETIRRLAEKVRRGDVESPRAEAEALLALRPESAPLHRFLGLLHCQTGDLPRGIEMLEAALTLDPADVTGRRALVQALADSGAFDRARARCTPEALARGGEPLWRLLGHIERGAGRPAAAAAAFEQVLARRPGDAVGWRHLADARHVGGDIDGATAALRRALALQPGDAATALNLASALAESGARSAAVGVLRSVDAHTLGADALLRLGRLYKSLGLAADALRTLTLAAVASPRSARPLVEIGLLRAEEGVHAAAEVAYREALARDARDARAYLYLGLLFEHSNRWRELGELIETASACGVARSELALLHAHALRRSGDFAAALAVGLTAPQTIEPARRAQLIGELADRLGDGATAFAAFREMNAIMAAGAPGAREGAARYRSALEARLSQFATGRSLARVARPLGRASPAFLLGLPRSGTTLLDTMLMGHPDVAVLEELPILQRIDADIGGIGGLSSLTEAELAALRLRYFADLEALNGPARARCIIDKHPLHVAYLPLIDRLFPDARLIFITRHPCDVVLSCFTTNFAINDAMANFLDLIEAAAFYDLLMRCWSRWRADPSPRVALLRYEALVASPEAEMRRLLSFLTLKWSDAVLDHRGTAAKRGYIASASYAQVGEPIHARSVERWRRYRDELAPVLPVLAAWVTSLGYTL